MGSAGLSRLISDLARQKMSSDFVAKARFKIPLGSTNSSIIQGVVQGWHDGAGGGL